MSWRCRHLASVQPLREEDAAANGAGGGLMVSAIAADTAVRLLAARFATSAACGAAEIAHEVADASTADPALVCKHDFGLAVALASRVTLTLGLWSPSAVANPKRWFYGHTLSYLPAIADVRVESFTTISREPTGLRLCHRRMFVSHVGPCDSILNTQRVYASQCMSAGRRWNRCGRRAAHARCHRLQAAGCGRGRGDAGEPPGAGRRDAAAGPDSPSPRPTTCACPAAVFTFLCSP